MIRKVYSYVNGKTVVRDESELDKFTKMRAKKELKSSPIFFVRADNGIYKVKVFYPAKMTCYSKVYIYISADLKDNPEHEEYSLYEVDISKLEGD